MKILVVLGRRMNDDGSLHADMVKRLNAALKFIKEQSPDRVIVSGGMPNKLAGITEAAAMRDYLIKAGTTSEIIITEDKSLTTKQNAENCAPILKQLNENRIFLCTSENHLRRFYLNPMRLFRHYMGKGSDIIPVQA